MLWRSSLIIFLMPASLKAIDPLAGKLSRMLAPTSCIPSSSTALLQVGTKLYSSKPILGLKGCRVSSVLAKSTAEVHEHFFLVRSCGFAKRVQHLHGSNHCQKQRESHYLWLDLSTSRYHKIAIAIAKECFVLSPHHSHWWYMSSFLLPFAKWCNPSCLKGCNLLDSKHSLSRQTSQADECNRHKFFSRFRGWTSIRGLPFDSWTAETFETIAKQRGRLIEIDEQTLNHKCLFEAKIRMECKGNSSIPHNISFPVDNNWISRQLSPIFSFEANPLHSNPNQKERMIHPTGP